MKILRKIYFALFKHYEILESKFLSYNEADRLIRQNAGKPDHEQWVLSRKEDTNHVLGWVYIERRKRITE